MKTIILGGGKGYRLKEETEFRPKPMVKVGDKPILWHIMKIYEHYGFNDFIITLGYKGDDIKDYFLNQRYFQHNFTLFTKSRRTIIYKDKNTTVDNFKITFVDTGLESLTGERVRRVKDFVGNETFMLTYGDGVSNVDIKEIIKFHKKKKVVATITGVHPISRYGQLKKDKNGLAQKFQEKPRLNDYVNGGFMVLEPEFFDYLKPDEMLEAALERLAKAKQLAIYTHDGYWHSMDNYQDVDTLNTQWKNKPEWKVW
jgi:glucose-1-phosphate cytidylyltransferase